VARRSSIFDDISKLPWQVGVVLAVLCYPAAILFKGYFAANPVLVGFSIATYAYKVTERVWLFNEFVANTPCKQFCHGSVITAYPCNVRINPLALGNSFQIKFETTIYNDVFK